MGSAAAEAGDPPATPRAILPFVRASAVDEDTLDVRGTRVRLHGIDAPEKGQTCKDARPETVKPPTGKSGCSTTSTAGWQAAFLGPHLEYGSLILRKTPQAVRLRGK
jgi:hypothetical protein